MTDEEALAFNDKFAALFDHAEDCDKLAQAVEKFYEDNKDTIATMKELEKKDPARKKAMQEKYKERLEPIRKKQTDAMQKCHDNAKLGEALKHYM